MKGGVVRGGTIYIYICMQISKHACMATYAYTYAKTCLHKHMHILMSVCVYVNGVCIYI